MSDVIADGWEEVLHMSQTEKILASPAQYKDFSTGQEISNVRVVEICKALDMMQKRLKEARAIYKRVMKDTNGSFEDKKMAAKKASEAHAGGGYTQLWNSLHQAKTAISLVATSPPPDKQDVAYSNERRLLIAIYLCDPSLQGLCQDIYTSIKEIDTLSQVVICVRYPYHMGERLQKLCKVLNTVTVENQKFSAKVVTEGMAPDHWSKPWLLHINGQRLAALDQEAITAATRMQPATCEEHFMKLMAQHTYHLCFHKSIAGEYQSAVISIWLEDYQWIQDTNKAWRLAQKLASNDEMQTMQVYFLISGLVIDAATQGKTQPGPDVFLYTCTSAAIYAGHQELFMSTRVEDTILALDAPFKLTFGEANEGSVLDAPGGIMAVYGFKYDIDGDKGIVIHKAGLVMLQHMTDRHHHNQLQIFGGQMTPHLAQFTAKIAVLQAAQVGEPASSSSNNNSANLLNLEQ